jgi:hypothetical protein
MSADLTCRDESRRQIIRDRGKNGVDYVDVSGTHLCVHFLTDIPPEFLPKEKGKPLTLQEKESALCHIEIRGGRRITNLHAIDFDPHATDDTFEQDCLGIELDREGDWSTYTLCFVECDDGQPSDRPLKSLDPRYACVDFSFKIDCPAEIDCKSEPECPPEERPRPSINYLARDYQTFRQLILDRLALLMPDWRERHVPDTGIAIVEVLAYVADDLSYYQDAVATEAYLDTARQRISVRRHARLVDYVMHDGCNARAFLFLQVVRDDALVLDDVYFVTRITQSTQTVLRQEEVDAAPAGWLAFEPLDDPATSRAQLPVWLAHNEIRIYTWGDQECCIPKGATRATLVDGYVEQQPPVPEPPAESAADIRSARKRPRRGHGREPDDDDPPSEEPKEPPRKLQLKAGDFLLFEELACAGTVFRTTEKGDGGFDPQHPAPLPDVDRTHRHVVRLTKVTPSIDPLLDQPVLEVEWSREDAMPFMLCVSAIGTAPQCDFVDPLAVARGNILLTDHGRTIFDEPLDDVPEEPRTEVCEGEDDLSEIALVAKRYRPPLRFAPLTFAQPLLNDAPAAVLLAQEVRQALPAVTLTSADPTARWDAVYDLLGSDGDDPEFVAEIDDDGRAHLRFGDGECGRGVEVGMSFHARYRTGNGRAGLVGPESIVHVVFRGGTNELIARVRNPLPSTGASDPEPVAEVKMLAPTSFRRDLQRAITGEDYATLARYLRYPVRNPHVQGAAGSLVWTGSWYEADVAVDPFGTSHLARPLRKSITHILGRYRRMGHDLRVEGAHSVPLRLDLALCIKPDYLRAHVLAAAKVALARFFDPDNLTFGEAVFISRIIAAVMAVDGVAEVEVQRLERLATKTPTAPPENGILPLAPNEVARLDNDPARPENGILTFVNVRGGR